MITASPERPRTVRGLSADCRAPRPRTVAVESESEREKNYNPSSLRTITFPRARERGARDQVVG
jgi:hypothetical protein